MSKATCSKAEGFHITRGGILSLVHYIDLSEDFTGCTNLLPLCNQNQQPSIRIALSHVVIAEKEADVASSKQLDVESTMVLWPNEMH